MLSFEIIFGWNSPHLSTLEQNRRAVVVGKVVPRTLKFMVLVEKQFRPFRCEFGGFSFFSFRFLVARVYKFMISHGIAQRNRAGKKERK